MSTTTASRPRPPGPPGSRVTVSTSQARKSPLPRGFPSRAPRAFRAFALSLVASLAGLPTTAHAAAATAAGTDSPLSALKKLSVEELMGLEVTSVSKRPEKLSKTASAIQVISGDDIRRSGATSLPAALRLATNLQVAQVNASQWAISARGFNNVLANKLLVMIDGRTVYTPLYAGVFWDSQDTLLEDVDRIEVISGPGGTLWGANAVNGVINVLTKSSKETQGWFVEGGAGNEFTGLGGLRYGGRLAPQLTYRVYAKGSKQDDTRLLVGGADARDDWHGGQGGLRFDWDADAADVVTVQADYRQGEPNPDGGATPASNRGGNLLGRWRHTISADSDFQLQAYYDRTWRDFNNGFKEGLRTYDLDWQHRLRLGHRHEIVWGAGFRSMAHTVKNLALFAFLPARENLHLYSAFLQDEITLVDDRLRLTLGSKFEHTHYTGLEVQPSGRLAWTPTDQTTLWTAVSRAVRTPARIDRDFYLWANPTFPVFAGGPNFESEKVVAYELGWRFQPRPAFSLSLASFYNVYDRLRSAEPTSGVTFPLMIGNGVKGYTYGLELAVVHQATDAWRLRGGYTTIRKHLSLRPGSRDANRASAESDDPQHQFQLQSSLNLPGRLELDISGRYIDELTLHPISSYVAFDVRLGWKATEHLELSIVGQNLTDGRHAEFIPTSPSAREIERGVFGKVSWRY